ncbi:MAG TPA: ubiquinone/menaquinone biosynthesis methyltransferase, partial [Gemmatimonadaceae bacterium]|nr:ubiquinone/menaquinone biosynthesis methyltransferase [Gemmatimonadaceae bacterium]
MTRRDDEALIADAARGGAGKAAYVRGAFSEIAPRYDLLNHLLSFNIDKAWRRRAVAELHVERDPSGVYLDLCAGTLDVSVVLAQSEGFRGSVVSIDFAEPMLEAGKSKVLEMNVDPVAGDALHLPLKPGSMSGAVVAFGIRNVADLDAALREVHRVLAPGARFVILEFSTPRTPLINAGYQLYFRHVLPAIGGLISGHRTAYAYLPKSVANFPVMEELARRMRAAGFSEVKWRSLTLGI